MAAAVRINLAARVGRGSRGQPIQAVAIWINLASVLRRSGRDAIAMRIKLAPVLAPQRDQGAPQPGEEVPRRALGARRGGRDSGSGQEEAEDEEGEGAAEEGTNHEKLLSGWNSLLEESP